MSKFFYDHSGCVSAMCNVKVAGEPGPTYWRSQKSTATVAKAVSMQTKQHTCVVCTHTGVAVALFGEL